MQSPVASSSLERPESPVSPLLLEDCFVDLQSTHLDSVTEPHSFMNTPSLFNELDDKECSLDDKGMPSPTTSTADSSDGLPITEESWSLLEEFEAFTKTSKATTVDSHSINNNDLSFEELRDEFVLPEFAKLDELLLLNNDEMSAVDLTPVDNSSSVDVLPLYNGLQFDSKTPEASTSDMLADLISHTLLMDPSLEGLLSSTTLDLSTVFGIYAKTEAGLETSNDNLASDSLCSPLQEVPEFQMTYNESKAKKRPVTSLSSCESEEVRTREPKPKKKKTGEEKYLEMRQKNNEASRRSRLMRKQKYTSLEQQAIQLMADNDKLKEKAEQLEKTVKSLKAALVRHILDLKSK